MRVNCYRLLTVSDGEPGVRPGIALAKSWPEPIVEIGESGVGGRQYARVVVPAGASIEGRVDPRPCPQVGTPPEAYKNYENLGGGTHCPTCHGAWGAWDLNRAPDGALVRVWGPSRYEEGREHKELPGTAGKVTAWPAATPTTCVVFLPDLSGYRGTARFETTGRVLAQGYRAQGIAGRMGGGFEALVQLKLGESLTVERTGRLRGGSPTLTWVNVGGCVVPSKAPPITGNVLD